MFRRRLTNTIQNLTLFAHKRKFYDKHISEIMHTTV